MSKKSRHPKRWFMAAESLLPEEDAEEEEEDGDRVDVLSFLPPD
jgi:hypothetical protein